MNNAAITATTATTPTESLQDIFRRLGRTSGARTIDATGKVIKRQIQQSQRDAAKTSEENMREIRAAIRRNALEVILAGRRRRKEIKEILAQDRKHRAEIREILRRASKSQRRCN